MAGSSAVGPEQGRHVLLQDVALKQESLAFILLNLCDLILISLVFRWRLGWEANPLARYVLRYWDMKGLVYCKFAVTAGVVVACQVVWHKYPRLARAVLIGGCLAYAYVVLVTVLRIFHIHL